jgi:membrane protease YdiL (CAAX protease family)
VLRYVDMMRRVADIENRTLIIVPVPLLSPKLSSHWLSLITDVDTAAGRSLVDSMVNEVVVEDDSIAQLVPFERMSFDDAVRQALSDRGTLDPDAGIVERLRGRLPMWITHKVPVRHEESPEVVQRRRRVVAGTSVVGAGLLGMGLSTRPGSKAFYATTMATAAVYTAGGFLSGPLHLGWVQLQDRTIRRPVITPFVTGLGAFVVFYAGGLVVREVPPLRRAIASVLQYSEHGNDSLVLIVTLANGAAEEIFFRGAVFAALGDKRPVVASTGIYMLATVPTRNPVLVMAAGAMGGLWGMQRRASNGLQAPVVTHLTWSVLMLKLLPPLFRGDAERSADARVI